MSHHRRFRRPPESPNLTPMVNIAMVVLVVFMLTVSFIEPQRFMQSSVALLEQGGQSNFPEDWTPPTPLPILVNMDPAVSSVFVASIGGQQTQSRDELIAILQAKRDGFDQAGIAADEVQVEISPQSAVVWQHLITVYEAAQLAGFTDITFTQSR